MICCLTPPSPSSPLVDLSFTRRWATQPTAQKAEGKTGRIGMASRYRKRVRDGKAKRQIGMLAHLVYNYLRPNTCLPRYLNILIFRLANHLYLSRSIVLSLTMVLTTLNKISIAQICVYAPALIIGVVLAVRHGFGRSSGWMYLILFSIIRILGAALQLETTHNPTDVGLYVGATTLQSLGLSPLILVMLGLLSRVVEGIRSNTSIPIMPRHIRIVQILVIVGLVLGIVGGTKLGTVITDATKNGNESSYEMPSESRIGLALMIAGFGLLVVGTLIAAAKASSAVLGERRLLLANGLSIPFVAVRVAFSALSIFTKNPNFRSFGGSSSYPDYFLGMSVVMEMAAVVIIEAIGLSLQKVQVGRASADIPLMEAPRRSQHSRSSYKPASSAPNNESRGYYQESGVDRV
ncbi:hypothetical protein VTK73DRAFT_2623 [Phialemonium thermophilum]|uniref:DUF7702 domain-containing protein n=1 Tax=Phialemonium thermophilum TaxID=223376 RepID=A0ABR3X3X1_9PEZI